MIKSMVERHVRAGKETDMADLLEELWIKAMKAPGYITGETLRSVDEPGIWLTISTWSDISNWRAWSNSSERQEAVKKIESLLRTPSKESIYEYAFRE